MKSLHGQSNVDPSPFNLSSQLIVKIKEPSRLSMSSVQISITLSWRWWWWSWSDQR